MELKKEVQDLATQFTSDLMSTIKSASVGELVGIVGAQDRGVPTRPAPTAAAANGHGKASTAKSNGNGNGHTAAKKPAGSRDRRSNAEMEKLRRGILATLAKSKGPMKTGAIAKILGQTKPQSMSFSMRQLVTGKLIKQTGERAKAQYTIMAAGKVALASKAVSTK